MSGIEKAHVDASNDEEYPFVEWPPNPPIGQLSIEALRPVNEKGRPLEGADLKKHLYALLLKRWGLTKEEAFSPESWIYKNRAPAKKDRPEEWYLRLLILILEGKSANQISTIFGIDLLTDEEIEKNGDYVGPTTALIDQHKKHKFSARAKEMAEYARKRASKLQLLAFPQIDPKTGQETRASRRIEEMRKKFGFAHRIQLFNVSSDLLPSLDGLGFYNFDTAIDVIYRSVMKGEAGSEIEQSIALSADRDYANALEGRNVTQLRRNLLSSALLEKEKSSPGLRILRTMAPTIVNSLLAGKTYAAIAEELGSRPDLKEADVVGHYVNRLGRSALTELSEDDIRLLLPRKQGEWSLTTAAFLFYFGKIDHGVAIDTAKAISRRSTLHSGGK